ncbi:LCA5L protein, partial [Neodrepanis coruscans]|nr:LCA5L protein [Neodrepanis coruscans]
NAGGKTFPAGKAHQPNSSFLTLLSNVNSQDNNAAAQRVSSARLHRMKELKNEIVDLERKIEASSVENQALRQLQSRQERAIDRYKAAESNFQDVLARHYEEMKRLRKLLKMSQKTERNMSKELKNVEAKLLKAKDALHTLVVLSEDKGLAEREELNDKLSVLTEKLEKKDEKIQSLEKQLKVNNMILSHQLASENKKVLQAGITTNNLKMEISSLQQKIKEKDRQLCIQNIYSNRMAKALRDRSDPVPEEQSRAVQVDKESFTALLLPQHQETEISPVQTIKEKNSSEDKDEEASANGTYSDAQSGTEDHSTKEILLPETSTIKHREFMEEQEKETEVIEEELQNLMKTEQSPQSESVQDNNHEEGAVEEFGKEEQQNDREKAGGEGATPQKTPIRLKKPLTNKNTKPKTGRQRQAGQSSRERADSRGRNSFGLQQPLLGKATKPRQEGATGAEGSAPVGFAGRRKQLTKELPGAAALRRDTRWNSNMRGVKAGK